MAGNINPVAGTTPLYKTVCEDFAFGSRQVTDMVVRDLELKPYSNKLAKNPATELPTCYELQKKLNLAVLAKPASLWALSKNSLLHKPYSMNVALRITPVAAAFGAVAGAAVAVGERVSVELPPAHPNAVLTFIGAVFGNMGGKAVIVKELGLGDRASHITYDSEHLGNTVAGVAAIFATLGVAHSGELALPLAGLLGIGAGTLVGGLTKIATQVVNEVLVNRHKVLVERASEQAAYGVVKAVREYPASEAVFKLFVREPKTLDRFFKEEVAARVNNMQMRLDVAYILAQVERDAVTSDVEAQRLDDHARKLLELLRCFTAADNAHGVTEDLSDNATFLVRQAEVKIQSLLKSQDQSHKTQTGAVGSVNRARTEEDIRDVCADMAITLDLIDDMEKEFKTAQAELMK